MNQIVKLSTYDYDIYLQLTKPRHRVATFSFQPGKVFTVFYLFAPQYQNIFACTENKDESLTNIPDKLRVRVERENEEIRTGNRLTAFYLERRRHNYFHFSIVKWQHLRLQIKIMHACCLLQYLPSEFVRSSHHWVFPFF